MPAAPEARTRRVYASAVGHAIQQWHKGRSLLLFTQGRTPGSLIDIWAVNADGTRPRVLVQTAGDDGHPALSPDGKWLARVKVEGNAHRMFVQPFEGGDPVPVPVDEGQAPMWAPESNALYFRSGNRFLRVPVRLGRLPEFGSSKELFHGEYLNPTAWQTNTVLTPDGKRFLLAKPESSLMDSGRIEVITNWFDDLRKRIPIGRGFRGEWKGYR